MAKVKKPQRDLMVLTRSEGVRKENPLMTLDSSTGTSYYPRHGRTPELRKEADDLIRQERQRPIAVQKALRMKGMTIRGTTKK